MARVECVCMHVHASPVAIVAQRCVATPPRAAPAAGLALPHQQQQPLLDLSRRPPWQGFCARALLQLQACAQA